MFWVNLWQNVLIWQKTTCTVKCQPFHISNWCSNQFSLHSYCQPNLWIRSPLVDWARIEPYSNWIRWLSVPEDLYSSIRQLLWFHILCGLFQRPIHRLSRKLQPIFWLQAKLYISSTIVRSQIGPFKAVLKISAILLKVSDSKYGHSPSSIYSWYISHILEQKSFC